MITVLLFVCLVSQATLAQRVQARAPVPAAQNVVDLLLPQQEAEPETQDTEATEDQETETVEPASAEAQELGEREIRLTLWDGTVVTGDIDVNFFEIETQFGRLEVPVKNIINLRPGLDSFPELTEKLTLLVEQLGDRDFQTREKAHRELAALGPSIRNELNRFDDGGSAERKKHLDKIKEEIDESLADDEDWGEGNGQSVELVRGDTIQTRDFTIVGRILQPAFVVSSKYGDLKIALSDIKSGDRTWLETTQSINKTINVKGNSFFQTTPVTTKIRVNKGDRIKIKASGNVQWASWGNISSGPDGITNQGNWLQFNCGTLVARIGNGTEYESVGSKNEFVAKSSGVLYLGIAMRDNYARQNGYQWPGEYKARITVTPKSSK